MSMRALGQRDAADVLDLGAGDGLVIGDDGERFDRGARQALLFRLFLAQQEGQIAARYGTAIFPRHSTRFTPRPS